MRCPACDCDSTQVVDTRPLSAGRAVRRRRQCRGCDIRFTTYERVELRVRKRGGAAEEFRPDKLRASIAIACAKRPVSQIAIDAMVKRIVDDVSSRAGPEIESREIGRVVMQTLEPVDRVAFIRYASVYRNFEDIGAFREAVDELDVKAALAERDRRLRAQVELQLDRAAPGEEEGA